MSVLLVNMSSLLRSPGLRASDFRAASYVEDTCRQRLDDESPVATVLAYEHSGLAAHCDEGCCTILVRQWESQGRPQELCTGFQRHQKRHPHH
ncbi:hypothetical protein B0H15DRAFT_60349 [Mycena belliarum]|uniref:Uncharacterized protein n=1 Tax=Mycena belliarum TaxID=1033014 RepID=A0AAD6TND9_9AGAR|nr:hypothetical protein B0H15DRAFT_60349 [Mycena belliae]